jgi:dTMP kinase
MVYQYLKKKKLPVLLIREPGGGKISEAIRRILLDVKNKNMTKECETLLYMAARAQLVAEVIAPVLNKGKIILCDRFLDSTLVYQGYGLGVDQTLIRKIGAYVTRDIRPDLTFVFDIDPREGLRRSGPRRDRIERRSLAYHRRIRQGYLSLARREPKRIKVIATHRRKEEVQRTLREYLDTLLKRKGRFVGR